VTTWCKSFWRFPLCKAIGVSLLLSSFALPGLGQLGLPPKITAQPVSTTVSNGGTVVFTVEAYSLLGVSYKWYHNGVAISGATQKSYTVNNAEYPDTGAYSVECRNLIGAETSNPATLTVLYPPLRFSASRMTDKGFKLQMAGPSPFTYVIWASTDFANWSPVATNTAFSGGAVFIDAAAAIPPLNAAIGANRCFYRASVGKFISTLEQSSAGGNKIDIRSDRKGAQTFRHGLAGDPSFMISKVVLHLSRDSGANAGSLNFSIGTGVNLGPIAGTGASISSTSITNTSGGGSFQIYEIVYDSPIGPFTAGTTYSINLESSDASARYYWEYSSGDAYARGTCYQGGSNTGKDAWFAIWGQ
jgi:hypothetical protein